MQRFQYKLPGPHCSRISQPNGSIIEKCPNNITDKLVLCTIPATDHVSRHSSRNNNSPLTGTMIEVRLPKCCRDEFRARLAVGIRIKSAQWVDLPVSPRPILVLVALVTRNVHDDAFRLRLPYSLE